MLPYNCPNPHIKVKIKDWFPYAQLVSVQFPEFNHKMNGIHSYNSVMVLPFKCIEEVFYIGILKEKRPLFVKGWLSAFPAGKIENNQTSIEAAHAEALQEAGLTLYSPKLIGVEMPFLHICDEKIYIFVANVKDENHSQKLEDGEVISSEITWMPWNEFTDKIRKQNIDGEPLQENAPMLGVSLIAVNKLLAINWEPSETFFNSI